MSRVCHVLQDRIADVQPLLEDQVPDEHIFQQEGNVRGCRQLGIHQR